MGDMNAKIGQTTDEDSLVLGKYGYGERNERGEIFIDFCRQHKLTIMNTMFKKPQSRRWTWKSPDGITLNEIDFITTNVPKMIGDVSTLNRFKFPTDHRLVRAELNLGSVKDSRKHYNTSAHSKFDPMKFRNILTQSLTQGNTNYCPLSIQEQYNSIENCILHSVAEAKLPKRNRSKNIITDEIKELIDERHKLATKQKKTKQDKYKLSKLYREINEKIRVNEQIQRLETFEKYINESGAIKKAYKHLSTSKSLMCHLKSKTGALATNRKEITHIATKFFENLYAKEHHSNDATTPSLLNNDSVPLFMETEVEHSIKKLKLGKSTGSDGISNEMIIAGKDVLTKPLTEIFNRIIEQKTIPVQWASSDIILLYKKGDPKEISNYRPISLMSCLYKVFASTLLRRITPIIDENQPIEQAGFMKNYSTVDHIHTLKMIIEKYNEFSMPLYIGFIDYSKAFDSITHNSIWRALAEQGVNNDYIEILKVIYRSSKARVKIDSTGPLFKLERGVRQGDPLSPKLFISVLEHVFRNLEWNGIGLKLHGKYLTHLRFADDLVLLAEDHKELQYMLQTLSEHSKFVGLEINTEKTKVMTNATKIPVTLQENSVEYVEEYTYLGHQISFNSAMDKEINRRIANTWKKYWNMKEIFKGTLPIKLKTKAMEVCLTPCLTYACQTWTLTKKQLNKIETTQRAMERSYLGIKLRDRIRNSEIRHRTQAKDIKKILLKSKWKWAGHLQRLNDDRWTKITTDWYPPGKKRKRGRPFKRWDDAIVKIAGRVWTRLARDRERWKVLEEAFTA